MSLPSIRSLFIRLDCFRRVPPWGRTRFWSTIVQPRSKQSAMDHWGLSHYQWVVPHPHSLPKETSEHSCVQSGHIGTNNRCLKHAIFERGILEASGTNFSLTFTTVHRAHENTARSAIHRPKFNSVRVSKLQVKLGICQAAYRIV